MTAKQNKNQEEQAASCRFGYTKPDDFPGCMFDEQTGLPSFNLFEDRLQTALVNERVKNQRFRRLKIAVVGIMIKNLSSFPEGKAREIMLRQTAGRLVSFLPQNYTVARGINYPFWIMMPYLESKEDGRVTIEKMKALLAQPVKTEKGEYRLECRIGAVLFEHDPEDSVSTLVGKAIYALKKAEETDKSVVYFSDLA